jgi:hypothetical protein
LIAGSSALINATHRANVAANSNAASINGRIFIGTEPLPHDGFEIARKNTDAVRLPMGRSMSTAGR